MLDVEVEHREVATVVRITGDVDGLTAETLLAEFQACLQAGHVCLVGDLSRVTYTSSAGLRAMLAVLREARSCGGDLRLAALHAPVLRILDLSGFTSILKVFADVDGAVASFAAPQ